MSGRVGDLSPKQAETLAKVRDALLWKLRGKWLRGWGEKDGQGSVSICDSVSLLSPPKGSYPTQPRDRCPDQTDVKGKALLRQSYGGMCRRRLELTQTALPCSCPHYLLLPWPWVGAGGCSLLPPAGVFLPETLERKAICMKGR